MAEQPIKSSSKKVKAKFGSKVMPCTCTGTSAIEYQDLHYGKGMRVFAYAKAGQELRCSCCTRMITAKGTQTGKDLALAQPHNKPLQKA